jgi:hypothetical protein
VFTARYALSPYIKQIRFVFKGLIFEAPAMSAASTFVSGHLSFSLGGMSLLGTLGPYGSENVDCFRLGRDTVQSGIQLYTFRKIYSYLQDTRALSETFFATSPDEVACLKFQASYCTRGLRKIFAVFFPAVAGVR